MQERFTDLYQVQENKFTFHSKYLWVANGNPIWVCLNLAQTYGMGDVKDKAEFGYIMAKLSLAVKGQELKIYERITLATIFEGVVVFKEDFSSIASAFKVFDQTYDGNALSDQAKAIYELEKNPKIQAVAWSQESSMVDWNSRVLEDTNPSNYTNIRELIGWKNEPMPKFQ